jgi:hypothetical protein
VLAALADVFSAPSGATPDGGPPRLPTLYEQAAAFLTAGLAYWQAAHAKHGGAVQLTTSECGALALFTRGEYRAQIMALVSSLPESGAARFTAADGRPAPASRKDAIERACAIIERGDDRLLAYDGPAGELPPALSLEEWHELYATLRAARDSAVPDARPRWWEVRNAANANAGFEIPGLLTEAEVAAMYDRAHPRQAPHRIVYLHDDPPIGDAGRAVISAAVALDGAATTERLSPDDVAAKYRALHEAVAVYLAASVHDADRGCECADVRLLVSNRFGEVDSHVGTAEALGTVLDERDADNARIEWQEANPHRLNCALNHGRVGERAWYWTDRKTIAHGPFTTWRAAVDAAITADRLDAERGG